MSCLAVSENFVAVAKGLHIDCYDYSKHNFIDIPSKNKQESDVITDITISSDCKSLAFITSTSKQLLIAHLPISSTPPKSVVLPRSASKIRFFNNNTHILIADKTGDVLIYDIKAGGDTCRKLLGHLSLLLDILQTDNGKFIITSDRDEKIRVSTYPNTYNIQTYCLGHKEFVNHVELLPHDTNYLVSTSGDGTIKFWNYIDGKKCYDIQTFDNIGDDELRENFIKTMDEDGVQVMALPIVHLTTTKITESWSNIAVTIHSYHQVLVYCVRTLRGEFYHDLMYKIGQDRFPSSMQFSKNLLHIYDDKLLEVSIYKTDTAKVTPELDCKIEMFKDKFDNVSVIENNNESIKVLYKRKFDNVQEYQERKRQRLEKKQ